MTAVEQLLAYVVGGGLTSILLKYVFKREQEDKAGMKAEVKAALADSRAMREELLVLKAEISGTKQSLELGNKKFDRHEDILDAFRERFSEIQLLIERRTGGHK